MSREPYREFESLVLFICSLHQWSHHQICNTANSRDAHSKDFWPIFDWFSLQFLFNFTANLAFFAVKMNKNWNENWLKIGYCECPGREILEKWAKIGSKAEPEVFGFLGWMKLCPIVDTHLPFTPYRLSYSRNSHALLGNIEHNC